ncbi:hypothetical protein ABMA27_000507 [Loxostege sticticalis]|uniref:THAP-type domain-containing protein n=1 Tax=Loxostege sticticalis TaxID=481309 RepID=A0ABR3INM5_LOXSC
MPSCVVKWCKNNTTSQKKCQGITFHRFPTGNEPWKDDWTRIIRNCRGQEDWSASKSSVVCSIHFDQNDLYTTSKERRRLVTYATRINFFMSFLFYSSVYDVCFNFKADYVKIIISTMSAFRHNNTVTDRLNRKSFHPRPLLQSSGGSSTARWYFVAGSSSDRLQCLVICNVGSTSRSNCRRLTETQQIGCHLRLLCKSLREYVALVKQRTWLDYETASKVKLEKR